jgi:hypothetical protein
MVFRHDVQGLFDIVTRSTRKKGMALQNIACSQFPLRFVIKRTTHSDVSIRDHAYDNASVVQHGNRSSVRVPHQFGNYFEVTIDIAA